MKKKGARKPMTIGEEELLFFEKQLKGLIIDIFNEKQEFTQTKNLSTCSYCDFKAICGR